MSATTRPSHCREAQGTPVRARAGRRCGGPWIGVAWNILPLMFYSHLLSAPTAALADPPPGDTAQLQQLNRANAALLGDIQSAPGRPDADQRQLNQRQRAEQRWLQERQRRELLMLNQRARTSARPGVPYRLQGIHMQRQFQLQQQNQLNRFRIQRGSPLR